MKVRGLKFKSSAPTKDTGITMCRAVTPVLEKEGSRRQENPGSFLAIQSSPSRLQVQRERLKAKMERDGH